MEYKPKSNKLKLISLQIKQYTELDMIGVNIYSYISKNAQLFIVADRCCEYIFSNTILFVSLIVDTLSNDYWLSNIKVVSPFTSSNDHGYYQYILESGTCFDITLVPVTTNWEELI